MSSAPYWKNRRLAPRAKRVLARRAPEAPVIAAYQATLLPKADAFISAYDRAARFEATWKKELNEGRTAIGAILKQMRSWLPLVVRDVPGFDASIYGESPSVPDDILEDCERLEDVVSDFRDAAGNPLPYSEALLSSIDIDVAAREWQEAEVADLEYQKLLAAVRTTGGVFDTELQRFRQTLLAVLGRGDKDYQKLRATRAGVADEDDDAAAPTPPAPVPPAPAGTTVPIGV